jgi:hypothetical protein
MALQPLSNLLRHAYGAIFPTVAYAAIGINEHAKLIVTLKAVEGVIGRMAARWRKAASAINKRSIGVRLAALWADITALMCHS